MHRISDDILKYLLLTFITAVVALTPSSCITDEAECPEPDVVEPGRYRLQFQIVTRTNAESRATDEDYEEVGSAAENYINVNDVRYLIFDSNRKFVADLSTQATTVALNEQYTLYEVVANVDIPFFVEGLEGTLDFYILALANTGEWGITVPTLAEGDEMETLFTNGLVMNTLPSASALLNADDPDATDRQYFPLAGIQRFTLTGSLLLLGTEESQPFDITASTGKSLNMLRSICKIEIVDKINMKPGAVFDPVADAADVRVKSAQLNGYNGRGCLLPRLILWELYGPLETQWVIAPTLPATPDYHTPPAETTSVIPGPSDYALPFVYDAAATAMRADKCPVYSCYSFELENGDVLPYFSVTLAEYVDPGTGEKLVEEQTLPLIPMYEKNNNGIVQRDVYIRNRIYRYEIVGISQELTVNWTVCDMDQANASIEFN